MPSPAPRRASTLGREVRGEHERELAPGERGRDQRVVVFRMHGNRLVRRQGPGRRGPDRDPGRARRGLGEPEASRELGGVLDPEQHVDRGRGAVLVLDLGLGQGRTAVQAPVHRLEALVEMPVADDGRERAQLLGLVLRIERQVGMVPVAHHAEALEILALHVDLLEGELAAGLAERARVHLARRLAARLLDLVLDRQAVAVPAGDVGRVVAVERARLDDHVL